jgi:hypothetical protein
MLPMFRSALRLTVLFAAAALLNGGAARAAGAPLLAGVLPALQGPVVIGGGGKTGLESWPLTAKGSRTPAEIQGIAGAHNPYGIAADGQHIALAHGNATIVYDLLTQHETVLPDTTGVALDVAYGKTGALYVANYMNTTTTGDVLVYPRGGTPYTLECGLLKVPDYIAVDNEGDVFINDGYLTEVIEIPVSGKCTALTLNPGEAGGYAAGVTIDPKTDDLLVLDNPDLCAGGIEGRLTTYRKPYEKGVGSSLDLGVNCSGGVHLSADSSLVFIGDQSVDGPPSFILQRTYPGGKNRGGFYGGSPYGFTTIPNKLPN